MQISLENPHFCMIFVVTNYHSHTSPPLEEGAGEVCPSLEGRLGRVRWGQILGVMGPEEAEKQL